jgi:CBS domain-containing protein
MQAQDIMTSDPACCTPDDSLQDAARLMEQHRCGLIPVVDNAGAKHLTGTITDRDIAIRAVAKGKGADAKVRDVMSSSPKTCSPSDDLKVVEQIMADEQVRRVPVVDERGRCIGIIAQADLATHERGVSDREVGRVVERISEPGRESRA